MALHGEIQRAREAEVEGSTTETKKRKMWCDWLRTQSLRADKTEKYRMRKLKNVELLY